MGLDLDLELPWWCVGDEGLAWSVVWLTVFCLMFE